MATTTYTFTPAAGQCADSASLTITVDTLITPSFNAIGPLCQNAAAPVLPLASANLINGSWLPDTINTSVSGATVYTFTPDSGMCATTADVTIDINPAPVAPIITLNALVLQSDAAAGNKWYNQNGLINGDTNQICNPLIEGDYYDIVTLNGCSSDTSNIISVVFTGVQLFEHNSLITVYPNPVSDELIIETGDISKLQYFEITNAIGQVVNKGQFINRTIVGTRNFRPGVYILKLENGNFIEFKKIIKE
jgi:hypothetical protein